MSDMSTHAFKILEEIDRRLERIESKMGQLVEEKDARDELMQAVVDIKAHAEALRNALPKA
jgi:DNA repair exonuclease SbcCD ATPase subunit